MPGRNITETVLLAPEIVNYHREKGLGRRTIKGGLFLCLQVVGNPSRYFNWVRECITTPMYSVAGYFRGAKGTRQRDPLSPHSFLLAMEFLNPTQMLKQNDSSLQGLQLLSQM